MQDKEFDKLFQDKFDEFEHSPSRSLWEHIEQRIEPKVPVKKLFPVYWRVAASIVVVLGAALWIISFSEPGKLYLKTEVKKAINPIEKSVIKPKEIPNQGAITTILNQQVRKEIKAGQALETEPKIAEDVKEKNVILIDEKKPQIALASRPKPDYFNSTKEIEAVSIETIKQPSILALNKEENAEVEIQNGAFQHNAQTETSRPKTKIKSVGDFVNFVVDKVDPRDEKLIQFRNGDEGSTVSSLNLGLLKFKAKEIKNNNSTF